MCRDKLHISTIFPALAIQPLVKFYSEFASNLKKKLREMNFRVLWSKGLGATNYLMLASISDSFCILTENPKLTTDREDRCH